MIYDKKYFKNYCIDDDDDVAITMIGESDKQIPEGSVPIKESNSPKENSNKQ